MTETAQKNKRKLQGKIVSDKMQKTVVVEVEYWKTNKKYRKQYKMARRFKAHSENNEYKTGDAVIIEESRPLSREKRWVVISKV